MLAFLPATLDSIVEIRGMKLQPARRAGDRTAPSPVQITPSGSLSPWGSRGCDFFSVCLQLLLLGERGGGSSLSLRNSGRIFRRKGPRASEWPKVSFLGFVLLVGWLFSLPQEEAFLGDTSL